MTSPLASRYTWLHGGAHQCLAVEQMTGKRPGYVFNDVRDPDKAGLLNAEEALRREYRVRLFNRKWIEGMMKGKATPAGADHLQLPGLQQFRLGSDAAGERRQHELAGNEERAGGRQVPPLPGAVVRA